MALCGCVLLYNKRGFALKIQTKLYITLGWVAAFHIVLGGVENSSFTDIGSAISKVLTMFSGELGFETTFKVFFTVLTT